MSKTLQKEIESLTEEFSNRLTAIVEEQVNSRLAGVISALEISPIAGRRGRKAASVGSVGGIPRWKRLGHKKPGRKMGWNKKAARKQKGTKAAAKKTKRTAAPKKAKRVIPKMNLLKPELAAKAA